MHDLLEPLAPEVDVDAAWDAVRDRFDERHPGRSARILAVAAALALVAGGIALAGRSGSSDDTTRPANRAPADVSGAVSVDVQPGWDRAVGPLVPDGDEVLAIGTFPLTPNRDATCAYPGQALDHLNRPGAGHDAMIWAARRPDDPSAPTLADAPLPTASDLSDQLCITPSDGDPGPPDLTAFDVSHRTYRVDGATLEVLIALGRNVTPETRAEAVAVLRSIAVRPELQTHVSADGRFLVEHPSSWTTADTFGGELIVSTGAIPSDPCAAAAWCECPGQSEAARDALGSDDALVTFDAFPAPALDLAGPRPRLHDLDLGESLPGGCTLGGGTTYFPAVGGRAIEVQVVLGPDASAATEAEALAIVNSVAFQPERAGAVRDLVPYADPNGLSLRHPTDWSVGQQLGPIVGRGPSLSAQAFLAATFAPPEEEPGDCPAGAIAAMGPDDIVMWIRLLGADAGLDPVWAQGEVGSLPDNQATCPDTGAAATGTTIGVGSAAAGVNVVVGPDATSARRAEALAILNSLRFPR